jgi:hypothetical protein
MPFIHLTTLISNAHLIEVRAAHASVLAFARNAACALCTTFSLCVPAYPRVRLDMLSGSTCFASKPHQPFVLLELRFEKVIVF